MRRKLFPNYNNTYGAILLLFMNFSPEKATAAWRIICLIIYWLYLSYTRIWVDSLSVIVILSCIEISIISLRFIENSSVKVKQVLLIIEFFAIMMLGYKASGLSYAEYVFNPVILLDCYLFFSGIIKAAIIMFIGLFGCTFFSNTYLTEKASSEYYFSKPITSITFIFYSSITVAILAFSVIQAQRSKAFASLKEEININRKLETINRNLSEKLFIIKQNSMLEERMNITHEIHDTAGYLFVNLIMMLQATLSVFNKKDYEGTDRMLTNSIDYARKGMNEIRYQLRAIRKREDPESNLQQNFYKLATLFMKATGVTVSLEYGNWPSSFNTKIDTFFISFFREALTNCIKHGLATKVDLFCWKTEDNVIIKISDNGIGFHKPLQYGIGITGIIDFVSSLNGEVLIKSEQGFQITVSIPISVINTMDQETFSNTSSTV